ncbi:MAG: AAA family ATPase, partial [Nocardioidaceae bacterium]
MSVPVLVAAAGAGWEAEALDVLARGGPSVVLHKRCVDVSDLLASASTGLASVALVSPALAGLDADSVSGLHRAGLGVLLVGAGTEIAAENGRLHRLGIRHVLETSALEQLPAALRAAADDSGPAGDAVARPDVEAAVSRTGRLVVVWGPTGAPGRTTVAVGLAAELAGRGETFLVDADPY